MFNSYVKLPEGKMFICSTCEKSITCTMYMYIPPQIPFHFINITLQLTQNPPLMTITVCEHPSIIGKASINDYILQMDANGSFKSLRTVKSPPFMGKSGYIMVNYG